MASAHRTERLGAEIQTQTLDPADGEQAGDLSVGRGRGNKPETAEPQGSAAMLGPS
jgi:hypothetical protein